MAPDEDGRVLSARSPGQRLAFVVLPGLALLMSWIVYRGVTRTYFFADDFVCMVDIANAGFFRFVLKLFGGHILVVRNVVFYVVYRLFGFDPRPYYWMTLLTHLLNVWLVYRVVRGFTNGNAVLASLGAAMWGTSPLGIGTIGWHSVYGQQMVTTFLLIILDQVLRTKADEAPSSARVAGWCLLLLAGMTCFGVGIGIAMAFPVALFLLVPATFARPRLRAALLGFPPLVAGLYFGFRRVYPLIAPLPMSEAILGSIAFSQLVPIVSMLHHLIGFGATGLLLGFRFVSENYPNHTSTLVVGLYLAAVAVAFATGDGTVRRRLAALAVLCVAVYAMIAIGRSNVYRAFKIEPYVSARQVRYQYLGLVPLTIALCVVLDQLARRVRPVAPVALAAWLIFTLHAYRGSLWSIDERAPIRDWVAEGGQKIESAIDAGREGEVVTIQNEDAPRILLGPGLGQTEFPGLAGLFVITHPSDVVRNRRVRFVERNPAVLSTFRDPGLNHRLADLLVSPDALAQAPAAR